MLTGSFDKTSKIWDSRSGECLKTLWGHKAEITGLVFEPSKNFIGTSSMDSTSRLYHLETGKLLVFFSGFFTNFWLQLFLKGIVSKFDTENKKVVLQKSIFNIPLINTIVSWRIY